MRILLIFGFLMLNMNLIFCQIQDTTCTKFKWIAVTKESTPKLFENSDTIKVDIFNEIKSLALMGKLQLKQPTNTRQDWLNSMNEIRIKDQERYGEKFYSPYFDYKSQGYKPYKNSNNEDSLISFPDGTMAYVYPEMRFEPITIDLVSEIRIMEERFIDSNTQEVYFKPTHLGFDIYTTNHNILFWVKIDDLSKTVVQNKSWVNLIQDKNYQGFQYQQYSCYDIIYRD